MCYHGTSLKYHIYYVPRFFMKLELKSYTLILFLPFQSHTTLTFWSIILLMFLMSPTVLYSLILGNSMLTSLILTFKCSLNLIFKLNFNFLLKLKFNLNRLLTSLTIYVYSLNCIFYLSLFCIHITYLQSFISLLKLLKLIYLNFGNNILLYSLSC